MQTELRSLTDVHPYDANPRTNDKAVDSVALSINEYGFRQPLVVDTDGVIICGHTRYKAAVKLGLEKVPVHVAKDLSEQQIKAYRIADNKTGELAEWDFELLPIELSGLQAEGYDLELLGFSSNELAKLIEPEVQAGLTDPDDVPEPPDEPVTQPGDLWILGEHRLLCGDSSKPEDVDRLVGDQPIHLVHMDPPYNVSVSPRSKNAIAAGNSTFTGDGKKAKGKQKMRAKDRPLANDFISEAEFNRLLLAWFENASRVLVPGGAAYIWGGYANLGNYPEPMKQAGLYFSQAIVWDKKHPVMTRKDFMGAFELCQPGDTIVDTPDGPTKLSSLRDGDQVITFAQGSSAIVGHRKGPSVRVNSRRYRGSLYGVRVGSKQTWTTDGHHFSVRLSSNANKVWCVYLMRRGDWWRVGKTQVLTSWGLGLKQRLDMENGEDAWILSTHLSNAEACCAEQIVSTKFGIPTTFWEESHTSRRTADQIAEIYNAIEPHALLRGVQWALAEYGRSLRYPFIRRNQTRAKYGRRISFVCHACNLLPGVMEVPVPKSGPDFRWERIDEINLQPFDDIVYSLDVEKYHHYIADGIVTHNCFYGWKEGAGHKFHGPNNATDLWHVKKVNPQAMIHLTEKPVELAVNAIQYSSLKGQNVLDLFGGSGSTMIGAEQTGRRAFLMELDAPYCDVIVDRYQRFTGKPAVLERTGQSPIPMGKREEAMR